MNTTLNSQQAASVVDGLNQYIENRTNRCWGTTTTIDERRDWAPIIWAHHQDVASVNSVTMGYPNLETTVLDTTSYFWDSYGRITMYLQSMTQFNPSPVNNDLVLINYTYGVQTVPDDLLMATLGIAAHYYDWLSNGQKDIVTASIGTYRLTFSGSVRAAGGQDGNEPSTAMSTDQQNWNIIDSYKMRRQ
jgi:hypothetical protein